ncbi:hypothetical protein PFTANZ_06056, partial [Plasmodium falciparum Tanzania (2000708)]
MPEVGSIGGGLLYALNAWKTTAIAAATAAAEQAGAAAGLKSGNAHGVAIVIKGLRTLGVEDLYPELLQSIGSKIPYNDVTNIANAIITKKTEACSAGTLSRANTAMCETFELRFGLRLADGSPNGPPPASAIPDT